MKKSKFTIWRHMTKFFMGATIASLIAMAITIFIPNNGRYANAGSFAAGIAGIFSLMIATLSVKSIIDSENIEKQMQDQVDINMLLLKNSLISGLEHIYLYNHQISNDKNKDPKKFAFLYKNGLLNIEEGIKQTKNSLMYSALMNYEEIPDEKIYSANINLIFLEAKVREEIEKEQFTGIDPQIVKFAYDLLIQLETANNVEILQQMNKPYGRKAFFEQFRALVN